MIESADPTVTYAGWVYKEGSLVKSWKKRFLVVKRRDLAYYKTTDHTSTRAQLMGEMRIARAERAPSITNGLIIHSMEGRQLKIFMDTAAERDKCFNAIADWCHHGATSSSQSSAQRTTYAQSDTSAAGRGSTHAATAVSVAGAKLSGWLEKQGQNMPTWKRRYFVLEDGILTYSAHETGPSLARHRVLGVRRDATRPFTLELTLDTGRELRVSGTSEFEIRDWQDAVKLSLQQAAGYRDSVSSQPRASGNLRENFVAGEDESWRNLFGDEPMEEDPNYASPRHHSDSRAFGRNIRLDFDGENPSFIECNDDEPPHNDTPKPKPFSPKAPGVETIRKMRIEQNLLDDDDDDTVITRVSSSQRPSGSESPVPSRRPKSPKEKPVGPGPCCCVVM